MKKIAPERFSISFTTQYGSFAAHCVRARAPLWVDRVYNLAHNGYFNQNYMFRVIPGRYVQFGTAGNPTVSNIYNYTSTRDPQCAILQPQPPDMPFCMIGAEQGVPCSDVEELSNVFGTMSMSTSYQITDEFPYGVTWNATAELFINLGNNSDLDSKLFVPMCTIEGMNTVLQFPSFGEVRELGGPGVSLGLLYQDGNVYIAENESWATMAKTSSVQVLG